MRSAADALAAGKTADAEVHIQRALERDPKSPLAWELRAQWAEQVGDVDTRIHALHKQFSLLTAQQAPKKDLKAKQTALEALDPRAKVLFQLRDRFLDRLRPIAEQYEKDRRPHSAIRVFQQMLALDPELAEARTAIERISAWPDPSLAETAKPKDLLDGVSVEWMRAEDAKHSEWKTRAKHEGDNYVTYTDAGYEVLVRAAEAMDQMNGFYRIFFQYGAEGDNRSVARIDLNIFKNRDEYLTLGIGPPVEWSGGHFTGGAVETYIGDGGFSETVGTLFHEAAHQFVSLATTASGWLNEGLASFFEGCRILNNGTVIMNMPANHRLFPLVDRLEKGWMKSFDDGLDPSNASATPTTAPTLQIIIENKYPWGPPWYAPTWGFVFFLYNYQDPADGRFIYRSAFREFINASGGRTGEGAIENFEEVVLKNPQRPTKGLPSTERLKLPKSVDELNEVWKEWLIALADEQAGRSQVERPYLEWARYAIERKELDIATEHFEKGVVQSPFDVDLLVEFAEHLADRQKNEDRASKLVLEALRVVESSGRVDEKRLKELERLLSRLDPKRSTLARIHEEIAKATGEIVDGYLDAHLPMMAMEVSWRLGTDLGVAGMFERFEKAARESERSIALWQLAYNEENLEGWSAVGNDVWVPYGGELLSRLGDYEVDYRFNFLTCDRVTSGDFSMELEVLADREAVNFCGLVFGRKSDTTFHALILHPGRKGTSGGGARGGVLELTSFFGAGNFDIRRSERVDTNRPGAWHKVRLDVVGSEVDVWWDGELVSMHDFASSDVLRGSFGLITGPGSARYKNIRYLSRSPRDPGSRIERAIRLERLEKASGGGAIGGSWRRKAPPFPRVERWVQGGRASFERNPPAPHLLVFWSIFQNDQLPIDKWLTDLAKRHKDVDLQVISIASYVDSAKVEDYLDTHPFPGSVGVDRTTGTGGFGTTFEQYFIGTRHDLPRLILIDVDGRVYWEGDPGFETGFDWRPGNRSQLDDSLEDLLKRRQIPNVNLWIKDWGERGGAALGSGDLKKAWPVLSRARDLPLGTNPTLDETRAWISSVENALQNPDVFGQILAEQGAEAAMDALVEWGAVMEIPISARSATVRDAAASKNAQSWGRSLKDIAKAKKAWKKGREEAAGNELVSDLASRTDRFSVQLREGLEKALKSRDLEYARALVDEAPSSPARWLVYHFAGSGS